MHVRNHMAILRNLRNITEAGISDYHLNKVKRALSSPDWRTGAGRVLPFRYTAAARACPQFEPALDEALCEAIAGLPVLDGLTVVLVDVSRSMDDPLSAKSDLKRIDAAATLASIIPGQCRVFTFSDAVVEVPPRKGMAGVDAIIRSQPHHSTRLFDAVAEVQAKVKHDRMIIVTDEQATGTDVRFGHFIVGNRKTMPEPTCPHSYVINVASAKNGVGYGKHIHIDGFSESVLRFIAEVEREAE